MRKFINIVETMGFSDSVKNKISQIAQQEYDMWDTNDPNYSDGGICHRIAYAVRDGVDMEADSYISDEENPPHTFILASLPDGTYRVDIPFHHYEEYNDETGTFTKKPNVIFTPDMVEIIKVSDDPEYAEEMSSENEY